MHRQLWGSPWLPVSFNLLFMRVFITSFFAHLFLNLYLGVRVWQALPSKRIWRIPPVALLVLEVVLYGTIYVFRNRLPDAFMYIGSMICLTWLMAMLYFTLILLVLDLLRYLNRRHPFYPPWVKRHYPAVKCLLLVASILLVGTVMARGYVRGKTVVVKEIELVVKKSNPKHPTLRVAIASDWHIGHAVRKEEVRHFVELINAQKPDLILLPGDLIDYDLHIATIQHIDEDMRQLHAPLGVYAVMGNHEYRGWPDAKKRWIRNCGITLLIDSVAMPDSSFYLIGRDDYLHFETRTPLAQLMAGIDAAKPAILIDHEPEKLALREAEQNGIDIAFYGHMHNGQVWPHNWMLMAIRPLVYGYKQVGGTQHFVTSGIGLAGPPLRIGSQSEMVVATLKFEGE